MTARPVQIRHPVAQTDWWMIFSVQTPAGDGEVAVARDAYEALVGCSPAAFDSEDARENALLELEIILSDTYQAAPSRILTVSPDEVQSAVARYTA